MDLASVSLMVSNCSSNRSTTQVPVMWPLPISRLLRLPGFIGHLGAEARAP